MDEQPTPDQCAQWLRALAEPLRLRIIRELIDEPRTVTVLANRVGVGLTTISHHLQVLLHSDLVSVEKSGRSSVYRLNPEFHRRIANREGGRLDFGCCRFDLF